MHWENNINMALASIGLSSFNMQQEEMSMGARLVSHQLAVILHSLQLPTQAPHMQKTAERSLGTRLHNLNKGHYRLTLVWPHPICVAMRDYYP